MSSFLYIICNLSFSLSLVVVHTLLPYQVHVIRSAFRQTNIPIKQTQRITSVFSQLKNKVYIAPLNNHFCTDTSCEANVALPTLLPVQLSTILFYLTCILYTDILLFHLFALMYKIGFDPSYRLLNRTLVGMYNTQSQETPVSNLPDT